ncbi:MAG: hypothetical protein RIR49_831 [Actinomycetota bacterium]|jgi:hypothetical protein
MSTIPKGHAPVNETPGDANTPDPESVAGRRHLIAGGLAAAALAIAGSRSAAAAPNEFTEDELALLRHAQRLELTASALYDVASASGPDSALWEPMSEQHEAYAHAIASLTGLSADSRDEGLLEALRSGFAGKDAVQAAYDLESAAVATHTELLELVGQVNAAETIASIISAESRHCVVLADALGRGSDLTALLVNAAEPILP